MTRLEAHKRQAKSFLDLYDSLAPQLVDFRIIALFYCAVHLIEMLAAHENAPAHLNHDQRFRYISELPQRVYKNYKPLYDVCRLARYDKHGSRVREQDVDIHYRRVRLHALEMFVKERLGEAGVIVEESPVEVVPSRPVATAE